MARLPRLSLSDFPHHVIQRGNNRQVIVKTPDDHLKLLEVLDESARKFRVLIHAYVVMDNHFHLLATPQRADGLSLMMQAIGRSYVRYFNARNARTGTLWEGRYKSTIVQSERYLLACMAYIDLNPVRAGLCTQAADFPWSSHAHYIGLRNDRLVTPHVLYWELGNTPFARELAYADLVHAGLNPVQHDDLTRATLSGWALGSPEFVDQLQSMTPRRVKKAAPGRPVRAHRANEHLS